MIASEVRAQVRKVVAPLVAEAVAHALTPERLEELRERATAATLAELVPAETDDGGGEGPSADSEDAPPPLYYGSVTTEGLAAMAGVAMATVTTGVAHAVPLTRVRRDTPDWLCQPSGAAVPTLVIAVSYTVSRGSRARIWALPAPAT